MAFNRLVISCISICISGLMLTAVALADNSTPYPSIGPLIKHSTVQRPQSLLEQTPPQADPDAKKVFLPPPSETEIADFKKLNSSATGTPHPLAIGFPRSFPERVLLNHDAMKWTILPDGGSQAAQVQLTSSGAQAIRLGIKIDRIDDGVELRFWGSSASPQVSGPITSKDIRTQDGIYWAPISLGESVTLEIRLPPGTDPMGIQGEIVKISHLVANPATSPSRRSMSFLGTPIPSTILSCEVDVACSNDAQMLREAKAVAQMLFMKDGSAYVCTGTLLNNTLQDEKPYFYTAAHCISDQGTANTLNTWWSYESPTCGGSASLTQGLNNLVNGAQLLYSSIAQDATLLKLNDAPPNGVLFSGWDAAPLGLGNAVVGIHHPAANPTKYSAGSVSNTSVNLAVQNGPSYSNFLKVSWSVGLTEEGSSGSGLFTAGTYILKGSLLGGPAGTQTCGGNISYYSPFSSVYSAISQFLSPAATHVVITGSPSGTPTSTSLSVQLIPLSSDIGKLVNFYVGVKLPDGSWQLYDRANSVWRPLGSGPLPVYQQLTMSSQMNAALFSNVDTTTLPHGLACYVGYGVTDADLLSGKYGVVYQVP